MDPMISPFVLAPPVLFLAGFFQGITGFGLALIALPLLSFFLDIKTAVPLCMLNGVAITVAMSLGLRRFLDFRKVLPLVLGSLPGVAVGIWMLKMVDGRLIEALVGVILLVYPAWSFWAKPKRRPRPKSWAVLAGFLTGAIGTSVSMGGPPAAVYALQTDWTMDEIKANLSGFFVIAASLAALSHLAGGLTTGFVLRLFLYTAPPMLLGVWTGVRLSRRLGEGGFRSFLLIVLAALGLVMLF